VRLVPPPDPASATSASNWPSNRPAAPNSTPNSPPNQPRPNQTPSPASRTYLKHVIATGTTAACKAAIEALIAEVKLTDQGVIPMFKIPTPDTPMPPPNPDGDTNEEGSPVRTMVRPVERTELEPGTTLAVDGYLVGNATLCSINSCAGFRCSAIVCDV
jgi:hypothetical protein